MTSPAVADTPLDAAPSQPQPAAAAPRVRAPLSRPRPPRPALVSSRAVAISVVLHALLGIVVFSLPERQPPAVAASDGRAGETVQYMDVSEWGAVASGGEAGIPSGIPAPEISAGAMDSVLDGTRAAIAYPRTTPTGIPGGVVRPGAAGAARPAGGAAGGRGQGAQPGAPAGTAGGTGQGAGAGTGRNPRSIEYGDRRLVVRPEAIPERPMSREERYQRHFESAIHAMNDSMADAAARNRPPNWTFGREGKKWGMDDRGIVVNGVHVPTPRVGVGRPSREIEEAARTERTQRAAIDRQSDDIDRDRNLRERGRATREREDERRRREREQQNPPPATP
ncbi:MAG TPA: hypothetical protein VF665_01405 [Longimicrobium sp.]|jgi:hypothetical protein|uniref:hypothetical protein n=1 Tax=Longimicrobium sp. TaxID=2029185 RepID=UPI002ED8B618